MNDLAAEDWEGDTLDCEPRRVLKDWTATVRASPSDLGEVGGEVAEPVELLDWLRFRMASLTALPTERETEPDFFFGVGSA